MKYIRLKNNKIYKRPNNCEWEFSSDGGITIYENDGIVHFLDDEIIYQADTIEELCDYVFYYNAIGGLIIQNCKNVNFEILSKNLLHGYIGNIKLAILTNKGLIYVAKMNEKGEFELL